jgi:leucyl-tRNA synthetase
MPRIVYNKYRQIILLARDLRKNATPSEKLLWDILRRKNLYGYRFLRQHPIVYRIDRQWIDFYIADFYSRELSLVIEVDGQVHLRQKEYDLDRDSKLSDKGIYVLRIKNEELEDKGSLIMKIDETINALKWQIADNK